MEKNKWYIRYDKECGRVHWLLLHLSGNFKGKYNLYYDYQLSIIKDYLPPISSTFQPYEFGEEYSKKTCLWLKGLPVLLPTLLCMDFKPYVVINGNLINGTFNLAERSKYRSKTFNGVARAMAQQWG